MDLLSFANLLTSDLRERYFNDIIKIGSVNEELWKDINCYLEANYRAFDDVKGSLDALLKQLGAQRREEMLNYIKTSDVTLFNEFEKCIFDLNDITKCESDLVIEALNDFNDTDIVKASLAVSPTTANFIQSLFPSINFEKIRKDIGRIPMNEISEIHDEMLKSINRK